MTLGICICAPWPAQQTTTFRQEAPRVTPELLRLRMDRGAHTVVGYLSPSHHKARPSLSCWCTHGERVKTET